MTELQKGCRDKLDKYINPAEGFIVSLKISGPSSYDFSCFGVDSDNKLSDERYMIFYNQTSSPEGAIVYNAAGFNVDLSKLPYSINRLVFTASIDGEVNMGEIASHSVTVSQNDNTALSMNLSGQDFHSERAVISIEIYHKDTSWRIAAVANGFNGGLGDLLRFYGGTEAHEGPDTTHVTQEQEQAHEQEAIPVITKRVELKKGVKVSLDKKIASRGEIVINLNWKNAASASGLFATRKFDRSKSIDLDIGCLYELSDGKRGSIQALGSKFGSLNNAPYISLDRDDRTGDAPEGENLRVNTAKIAEIRRILVYTFIYEGVNSWQEADGVITIKCP